jgi:hypothetical protein
MISARFAYDGGRSSHRYLDGKMLTRINGTAFSAYGETLGREFPQEPTYIMLEVKLAPQRWGVPADDIFPLQFQVGREITSHVVSRRL